MDVRFGYRLLLGLLLLPWGPVPVTRADSAPPVITGTVEYLHAPDPQDQWLTVVDDERKKYFFLQSSDPSIKVQILQASRDHRRVTLGGIQIFRGATPFLDVQSLWYADAATATAVTRAPQVEPLLPPDPLAPHHFRPRAPTPPVAAADPLAPGEPKLPASPAPPQARVPQRVRAPFTVDELRGDDGGQTVEVENLP